MKTSNNNNNDLCLDITGGVMGTSDLVSALRSGMAEYLRTMLHIAANIEESDDFYVSAPSYREVMNFDNAVTLIADCLERRQAEMVKVVA